MIELFQVSRPYTNFYDWIVGQEQMKYYVCIMAIFFNIKMKNILFYMHKTHQKAYMST